MDLSFDKLLEQFDLKRNEHQKNMHKVNKRIDEIESHMEEIKKQLHSFDHQIVNLEKDLKTTLSMIQSENETNLQHKDGNTEHQNHHGHKEHKNHKNHKEHEHHTDQHNWAKNLLNNVEEFSASIFESNNEEHKEHNEHKEHKPETSNNSRVANRKRYNDQNSQNMNQYTASTVDESHTTYATTGLTSLNQKNYTELASSTHTNSTADHYQENNISQKKSEQLLETNFSDLSIDDWEDSTTNLSMSEWFEVDPNSER